MPESVLDTARVALTGSDETADLLRELEEGRRKAIAEGRAAEQARVEAQMLRRRYADELSNLEALRRESPPESAGRSAGVDQAGVRTKSTTRWPSCAAPRREGKQTERVRQKIKDIGSDLQAAIQNKLSADQPAALEFVPDRPLRRGDKVTHHNSRHGR